MSDKLLTGEVVDPLVDHYERELDRIKRIGENIANQLHDCRAEFAKMKAERDAMVRSVAGLRKLLGPLWGELENVPVSVSIEGVPPQNNAGIWEEWKRRLGGGVLARFIDAFLTHGELDSNQLSIITQCGRSNVPTYIHRLKKADLINKNGNKYSLKEI